MLIVRRTFLAATAGAALSPGLSPGFASKGSWIAAAQAAEEGGKPPPDTTPPDVVKPAETPAAADPAKPETPAAGALNPPAAEAVPPPPAGAPKPATAPGPALSSPTAERFIGAPDAKTTVIEFFSLTCSHCAAFATGAMPRIKKELVETGKVRWVFHDYPLDQIALLAAQVARYLPVNRYEPFIDALLSTQDRWAFARGIDNTQEIWKTAALAGMSRPTFDKAIADTALRDWIVKQQQADTDTWKIDATPSFVINGKKYSGEMNFESFSKLVPNG